MSEIFNFDFKLGNLKVEASPKNKFFESNGYKLDLYYNTTAFDNSSNDYMFLSENEECYNYNNHFLYEKLKNYLNTIKGSEFISKESKDLIQIILNNDYTKSNIIKDSLSILKSNIDNEHSQVDLEIERVAEEISKEEEKDTPDNSVMNMLNIEYTDIQSKKGFLGVNKPKIYTINSNFEKICQTLYDYFKTTSFYELTKGFNIFTLFPDIKNEKINFKFRDNTIDLSKSFQITIQFKLNTTGNHILFKFGDLIVKVSSNKLHINGINTEKDITTIKNILILTFNKKQKEVNIKLNENNEGNKKLDSEYDSIFKVHNLSSSLSYIGSDGTNYFDGVFYNLKLNISDSFDYSDIDYDFIYTYNKLDNELKSLLNRKEDILEEVEENKKYVKAHEIISKKITFNKKWLNILKRITYGVHLTLVIIIIIMILYKVV